MATPATKDLGEITELQLAILSVLWERGEATVRDVHATLGPSLRLARKTFGTLLHRLAKRGILKYRVDGREYLYRPAVTREAVQHARVAGLVGGLFDGDFPALVSFAVSKGDVDSDGLRRIRQLLDQHTRRR